MLLVCCQPLYGKQMVAIGNSITAPKDSWAWITAQHFDMELTNLAVSGAQWTDYQGTTVDTNPKPVYDGVHTNNVISNQVYRFLQLIVPEGEIISEAEGEKFHTSTPAPLTGLKTKNSTLCSFRNFFIVSKNAFSSAFMLSPPIGYDRLCVLFNDCNISTWKYLALLIIYVRK